MVYIYDGFKTFSPTKVIHARSTDDVIRAVSFAVSSGLKIRPMGLGYSWSEHCFTNGISLQLDGLRRLCVIDQVAKTITVDAGVRMGDVTRALGRRGLCLPSLAFLPEMTAGGAVATATHGTNHRSGTMSDSVVSMDVVLASGELKTFDSKLVSEAEMCAARVSVGMLGVITKVVFQAIDMPWVHYTKLEIDLDEFMATRDAVLSRYAHVWAHWSLGANKIKVDCLEERQDRYLGFNPYVMHRNAVWEPRRQSMLRSMIRPAVHMARDIVRSNGPATKARSKTHVQISMQYSVHTKDWERVVDRIAASQFARSNFGKIMEMKFVKGNNLSYLGPNAGQDAVCFNVYWLVTRSEQDEILRPFEELMRSFSARPHWGKDHKLPDETYMKSAFPQWEAFNCVRRSLDKNNLFSIIR
ncbi:FAD-binding protein [Rhizobium tumorigenes]|uniref:FAD-binding protein n=1 Tax=Rhizobium tumorigenes TaxID=2041385 RepID=A0AAF1K811_9HYPH|nr:FAD-binding protein [Rhizobium tumorigenes]WFR97648.1 FAD-binding protein [Rhizobium tumorigenes]